MLNQQRGAAVVGNHHAGWLTIDRGHTHRRVGQPQGDFMPALAEQLDRHPSPHADDVGLDRRLALNVGDHRANRRRFVGSRLIGQPRLTPELLKLLVRDEDPAAILLKHAPQFAVGDVDRLLAEGLFGGLVRNGDRLRRPAIHRRLILPEAHRSPGQRERHTRHNDHTTTAAFHQLSPTADKASHAQIPRL